MIHSNLIHPSGNMTSCWECFCNMLHKQEQPKAVTSHALAVFSTIMSAKEVIKLLLSAQKA